MERDSNLHIDTLVVEYHKADDPDKQRTIRDKVIDVGMLAIDQNYSVFVENFSASRKNIDSFTGIGAAVADVVSAAMSPPLTKTVLSLFAGSLNIGQATISKNYFYEQTILVLVKQMEAERRRVAASLLAGQRKDIEQYSLTSAINDLEQYYFAGSVEGALSGAQGDATTKQSEADRAIENIRGEVKAVTGYRDRARAWVQVKGVDSTRRQLVAWIQKRWSDPLAQAKISATVLGKATENGDIGKVAEVLRAAGVAGLPAQGQVRREDVLSLVGLTEAQVASLANGLNGGEIASVASAFAFEDPLELNK